MCKFSTGRILSAAFAAVLVLSAAVFAQDADTAYVPFLVNVDATVTATRGAKTATITVTANKPAVLAVPLAGTTSAGNTGAVRGLLNAPAITNSRGNITLRLPAQSYQHADISLHAVNGKRIMRGKAAATETAAAISRKNVAAGVYLLSVKGVNGSAFTTRLTHSGGNLNISAVFGGESVSPNHKLAKSAAAEAWTIKVSALTDGYIDSTYSLNVVSGSDNDWQEITLREKEKIETGSWTWETFDDAPDGGTSSIVMSESDGAINISGTVTSVYDFGYVGLMAFPDETEMENLKKMASISFKVKGDGRSYRIVLPTSNVTDYGYYTATFTATSAEKTVTLNITDFRQPTWAKSVALNLNLLERIQLQTADGFTGAFNLTISGLVLADKARYTVTFSVNGGTGTAPAAQSVYSGSYITLPGGSGLSKTNATFGGWNTTASGTGTNYNAGASYSPTANVTLYAKWNAIPEGTFIDSRDGKSYRKKTIDRKVWMAQNLNYSTSNSVCGNDACGSYGQVYTWADAMEACPTGWSLPTESQWTSLVNYAGSSTALKSRSGWNSWPTTPEGTDDYGFAALPAGYAQDGSNRVIFTDPGVAGYWWTAGTYGAASAIYVSMRYDSESASLSYSDRTTMYSVRCVED